MCVNVCVFPMLSEFMFVCVCVCVFVSLCVLDDINIPWTGTFYIRLNQPVREVPRIFFRFKQLIRFKICLTQNQRIYPAKIEFYPLIYS